MGRKVDLDDLVDSIGIAERLGFSHTTSVQMLRRRHPDFPEPLITFGRVRVWSWTEVESWAKKTGRLP